MSQESTTCQLSGEELSKLIGSFLDEELDCSIRVHGGSMHPFIRDGDLVKISKVSKEAIHLGDIVVVEPSKGASPLVHRVIGRHIKDSAMKFLIRGDRCGHIDGWMSSDNIMGMVCDVSRNGKKKTLGIARPSKWIVAMMSRIGLLVCCLRFCSRVVGRLIFALRV